LHIIETAALIPTTFSEW